MILLPLVPMAGAMVVVMEQDPMPPPDRPGRCAYTAAPADRAVGLVLRPGDRVEAVLAALGPATLSRDLAGGGRSLEFAFAAPRVAVLAVPDLPAPGGAPPEPVERRIANLVVVADAAGHVTALQDNPNSFTFGGPRTLRGSADRLLQATLLPGPGQWVACGTDRP